MISQLEGETDDGADSDSDGDEGDEFGDAGNSTAGVG